MSLTVDICRKIFMYNVFMYNVFMYNVFMYNVICIIKNKNKKKA